MERQAERPEQKAEDQVKELETLERESRLKALPEKVRKRMEEKKIVRLERERKIFTDLGGGLPKARCSLSSALNRSQEDGRVFLKTLFRTPGNLIPGDKSLTVRLHSMSQPRLNTAVREICEMATRECHTYPGTELTLVFEGPQLSN